MRLQFRGATETEGASSCATCGEFAALFGETGREVQYAHIAMTFIFTFPNTTFRV